MLDNNKATSSNIKNKISAMVFKRAWPEIILGLISTLIIYRLFNGLVSQYYLLYWLASAVTLYLLRIIITGFRKSDEVRGLRLFIFFLLLISSGVLWGAAGYFTSFVNSDPHKLGFLIWLTSLIILVALGYSNKLTYYLGFTVPAVALTALGLNEQSYPWNPLATYSLIAFATFLFLTLWFYRSASIKGIRSQIQLNELNHEYDTLIGESKRLQLSLNSTNKEHKETVATLDKTKKDLHAWHKRSKSLINTLRSQIRIDPVTNLPNQKTFTETISQEWQRSTRSKDPITLAYITVDHFDELKEVKDQKSILSVLKKVAASIKSHGRRAGDLPAHLDNEANFALLLVGADAKDATRIVDDIRNTINELNLMTDANHQVTIHAGVATKVPDRKIELDELYEHAESANYEAEFQGGNRVISYRNNNDIKILPWDQKRNGDLTEENFEMDLFSKGYATMKEEVSVGTVFRDQRFSKPTLFATYSGTFTLNIDGQIYALNAGEHLIIPEDLTFSAEVTGDKPLVLYFENTKVN
ncbi:MAG: diguanylate cyclase [Gammaproteobacteria bacterium]